MTADIRNERALPRKDNSVWQALIVDTIHDDFSNSDTEVLLDTSERRLTVAIILSNGERVETFDDTFPNLKMLSAQLACTLLLGPAKDFLARHNVPKQSDLWDLNHSNPWEDELRSSFKP